MSRKFESRTGDRLFCALYLRGILGWNNPRGCSVGRVLWEGWVPKVTPSGFIYMQRAIILLTTALLFGANPRVIRRPALASAGQRISNAYLGGQGQTASGSAEARNRAAFQRPPHLEANYKYIIRCESKLPSQLQHFQTATFWVPNLLFGSIMPLSMTFRIVISSRANFYFPQIPLDDARSSPRCFGERIWRAVWLHSPQWRQCF